MLDDYKKELIKDHPYIVENDIDLLHIGDAEDSLKELKEDFKYFNEGVANMQGSNLPVVKNILKNKIDYCDYADDDNGDIVYLENCEVLQPGNKFITKGSKAEEYLNKIVDVIKELRKNEIS